MQYCVDFSNETNILGYQKITKMTNILGRKKYMRSPQTLCKSEKNDNLGIERVPSILYRSI